MLIRYLVRRRLHDKLIIRINPRRVAYHAGTNQPYTIQAKRKMDTIEKRFPSLSVGTKFVNKCLYSVEPFLLSRWVFDASFPIEHDPRYQLLQDIIVHRNSVESSKWFEMLMTEYSMMGLAQHKSLNLASRTDIVEFLQSYVIGMIKTLETTGYDETVRADTGTAFIDQYGKVLKSDQGNHRFAAARILGVPIVPLEILGVQKEFFRREVGGGLHNLNLLLQKVQEEHQ